VNRSVDYFRTKIGRICAHSYVLANLWDVPFVIRRLKVFLEFKKTVIEKDDQIYQFATRIGIGQIKEEIEWVADLVQQYQPRNIVEIGTQKGGNAFYLSNFAPVESKLITIDIAPYLQWAMTFHNHRIMTQRKLKAGLRIRKPGLPFTSGYTLLSKQLIRRFSNKNCQVIPYYTYLNPEEDAAFIVQNICCGENLDLIFYDADKTEEGVRAILKAYVPRLKTGGMLVIQDINYAADSGNNGMTLFWENLDKSLFRKLGERIVNPSGLGCGIGAAIKL